MEAHPGITFRPGPSGRRPALISGPDVWEVIRVVREMKGTPAARTAKAAELTGLRPDQIISAAEYYGEYREEIDAWISFVDDYAEAAEAAYHRGQAVLEASTG